MHTCSKFILILNDNLHVSEVFLSIIKISRLYIEQQAFVKEILLFDICLLLYVQSWTPDDERNDHPKQVESHSKTD